MQSLQLDAFCAGRWLEGNSGTPILAIVLVLWLTALAAELRLAELRLASLATFGLALAYSILVNQGTAPLNLGLPRGPCTTADGLSLLLMKDLLY